MRVVRMAQMVAGSALTYLVVAACGGGKGTLPTGARGDEALPDGAPLAAGLDGDTATDEGVTGADSPGSILDAITNPEGEAQAATPPDIATETCSHTVNNTTYAEHLYPGKTADQLTLVSARLRYAQPPPPLGSLGYQDQNATSALMIKDGAVAVVCGASVDHVVFILPGA